MTTWKVEPKYKKSVRETGRWEKRKEDGTFMVITETIYWRWATFFVITEDDTPPVIDEDTDMLSLELEDWSSDDGVYTEYSFENMTEEEFMSQATVITDEDIANMPEEIQEQILNQPKRTLQ